MGPFSSWKRSNSEGDSLKTLDGYEDRSPSAQNAIDTIDGWSSAFDPEFGVSAGIAPLMADDRVLWGLEQCGGIADKKVLELGPLEGAHSVMLERAGASEVIAVEANKKAFLKCLITKEITGLKNTQFLLGDFLGYLEGTDQRFDFLVASGVLYHMKDPLRLLKNMAEKSDSLLIWTHYFDDEAMPKGDQRRLAFAPEVKVDKCGPHDIRLYRRGYFNAWKQDRFCGGPENTHYWMERDQIVEVLRYYGFSDIRLTMDDPHHNNGPSVLMYCQR